MPTEIINIITCLKIKYRQRHHNSKQRIVAVAFGSFDCLYILFVSLDLMILVSPVRPNSMHLVTVTHWLFI